MRLALMSWLVIQGAGMQSPRPGTTDGPTRFVGAQQCRTTRVAISCSLHGWINSAKAGHEWPEIASTKLSPTSVPSTTTHVVGRDLGRGDSFRHGREGVRVYVIDTVRDDRGIRHHRDERDGHDPRRAVA